MIRRDDSPNRWRNLVALLALLFAMGLTAQGAFAGRLTDTAAGLPKAAPPASSSGVASVPGRPQGDAFMTIDPSVDTFGNLGPINPSSGDTVGTGNCFALDVNVHGNSSSDLTAAQAYVAYGTPANPGD